MHVHEHCKNMSQTDVLVKYPISKHYLAWDILSWPSFTTKIPVGYLRLDTIR